MHEINWARFILKNPNPQDAFETMCRNIFLREYEVGSHRFSSNYNQTGLETEPVLYEGKFYGFQCKYSTSGNNNAFYKEVLNSLTKAVTVYPNLYSTLDGGADKEHFRFVVEKCCPHLLAVLDEITVTADSPERTMGWESFASRVSGDGLSLDNLHKYYCCEVEGINYSSVLVWKDLIQFEMMRDSELTVLYDTLGKNYYPNSGFSKISHCFPIVTAVLLSNPHTRAKALEFLMKRAGRMGLVTLIKAYGLIGDDQSGRQCIEQLIRLCEAMVYPSTEQIENVSISKNRDWEIINKVCDSKIGDWNCEEKECIMHSIPNPKIIIKWDQREDMEPFSEDWATRYPKKDAYSIAYYICYEQEIIKVFNMVYVDGSRALIPMPDYVTKHIDRISYQFACLVNCDIKTLNGYIRSSGLVVD